MFVFFRAAPAGRAVRHGVYPGRTCCGPAGSLPLVGLATIPAAANPLFSDTDCFPIYHQRSAHPPPAGPKPRPGPGRRSTPSLPCSARVGAPYLRPQPRSAASAPPFRVVPALSPPHRHRSSTSYSPMHPRRPPTAPRPRRAGPEKGPTPRVRLPGVGAGRRLKKPAASG